MILKRACIFLIALLFINKGNAADSDGKEFVFSFIYDVELRLSPVATTTVIVIPSYNDSTCSFTYKQNSDDKIVTVQEKAKYGKTNEFRLSTKEVIVEVFYLGNSFFDSVAKDFRIFVSCTEEVKLMGKITDPVYAWGDLFLIPSLKNAGTLYNVAVPTSDTFYKGTVAILPVQKTGTIDVNILGYVGGALFSNQTIQYESTFGQKQHFVAISMHQNNSSKFIDDVNATISITTSSPVMLSFEAPETTSTNINGDRSCGTMCYVDFVQFMPVASLPLQCHSMLTTSDQRMITSDFTARLHVAPPNLGSQCDTVTKMTLYDNVNNVQGTEQIVDKMGFTEISLNNITFAGFSTVGGEMSTNRFGSMYGFDGADVATAYGHFMHYVPSTQEWVTGKTQFFTLAKDCSLEFYSDSSNADLIKIDGKKLSSMSFKQNFFSVAGNKYSQFVVKMTGYGLHNIENDGSFVAYVICGNVASFDSAAGFLTGFNQRKTN